VVGLLIVYRLPEDPDELIRLLRTPHPALRGAVGDLPTGRHRRRLTPDTEQLWMLLPGPVTHRLNALIELVHERGTATSRRQVVTTAILHGAPDDLADLVRAYDAYEVAVASDAEVPAASMSALEAEPPRPGRRPM
jgi:hypothetical protein